jgi:putative protease
LETALSAFAAGAAAVYLGLKDFSARAFAKNFTYDEIDKLLRYASANGNKKVYVTFNTLVDQCDIEDAVSHLAKLSSLGVHGVIVQDIGIAKICREYFPDLDLHASTQMVVHNLEGVMALKDLGFKRIVLARELSLEEITSIAKRCSDVELEVFIHGALCYSISGLCLFSAIEKNRSGNRGKCAYCCRLPHKGSNGKTTLPFSMRDLRLDGDIKHLIEAGVKSLKIEGRMKSPLYVSSVVSYYRSIIDSSKSPVSIQDVETVFSRNTTRFLFDGKNHCEIIDEHSPLGHLGAEIGIIKHITKDREGNRFIRFHTNRALEKHDGLQFDIARRPAPNEKAAKWTFAGTEREKIGFGISVMRRALSRVSVCRVEAGTDVEVLIPENFPVKPSDKVYCSMSNEVKRKFKPVVFRESDYLGLESLDVEVVISKNRISANGVSVDCSLEKAKDPSKTFSAVEKAFSKLGASSYRLGRLKVVDVDNLYAPMGLLNDLRRKLIDTLTAKREEEFHSKVNRAIEGSLCSEDVAVNSVRQMKNIKIRAGQPVPVGDWDEVIVAIDADTNLSDIASLDNNIRLSVPVWNDECSYNSIRIAVKRFVREGFVKWECSDIATLRTLKEIGVKDIVADWTLYAYNYPALKFLSDCGVRRFVASPENNSENIAFLKESGFHVEFLVQQTVPLFISKVEPKSYGQLGEYKVYKRNNLFVTARNKPTLFKCDGTHSTRIDLSWDPPLEKG